MINEKSCDIIAIGQRTFIFKKYQYVSVNLDVLNALDGVGQWVVSVECTHIYCLMLVTKLYRVQLYSRTKLVCTHLII